MANIPLAQIPNAPQATSIPHDGVIQGVDLSRAATLLSVPQGAFNGEAAGMKALASGIGDMGKEVSEIGFHIKEQQDENAVYKANDVLTAAHNAANEEIAANPTDPSRFGEIMAKHMDSARDQIFADDGLSRVAKTRIQQHFDTFRTNAVGQSQLAGVKTLFQENKDYAVQNIKDLVSQGNTEAAVQQIEAQRGKLLFDSEAEGLMQHAKQQGDLLSITKLMQTDPEKAKEMLGDEKALPNIPAIQKPRLIDQADTEQRRVDSESWDALVEGVSNGTISDPEQAKNVFGDQFATKYASKIKSVFAANPDWDKAKENYADINKEISKLDPNEPDAIKRKFDLLIRIRSELPEGFRQDSLDYLNGTVNNKPQAALRSQLTQTVQDARTSGLFGAWDAKKIKAGGDDATPELAKKNQATSAMYRVEQDGVQYLKQNPGVSSEDYDKWIKQRMSREIKQSPVSDSHWYNPFSWGSTRPTPSPVQTSSADAIQTLRKTGSNQ